VVTVHSRSTTPRRRADVFSALAGITEDAVEQIAAVAHAGITFIEPDGTIRSLAATDGYPLVLDNLQRRFREGPCYDSATEQEPHLVNDLETDGRWPMFARQALVSTPVRAIVAVPILDDEGRAALNLYADRPNTLDVRSIAMGRAFAQELAEVMTTARGRKALRRRIARPECSRSLKAWRN
jgi:hypothetical protein